MGELDSLQQSGEIVQRLLVRRVAVLFFPGAGEQLLRGDLIQAEQYFTMAFAVIDRRTGRLDLVQAGHPHPAVLRADGTVDSLGNGGLPVGLIEGARYETITTTLSPGDRLFMVSDGVTEAADAAGALLDDEGFADMIRAKPHLRGLAMLEAIQWDLADYTYGEMADDVSAVLFEFNGAKINIG